MGNDLFNGIGDLIKALSVLVPDEQAVKLMNAKNEVNDLKAQESAVYLEIGKLACRQNPEAFPEQTNKLRLIQDRLAEVEEKLKSQTSLTQAARQAAARRCCPNCGRPNAEGVKFCQECGAKLTVSKVVCPACGRENQPETKFCGDCGHKIGV